MDNKQIGDIYLNEAHQLQRALDDFIKQLMADPYKMDKTEWKKIHATNLEFVARALVWSTLAMHVNVTDAARKVYHVTVTLNNLVKGIK